MRLIGRLKLKKILKKQGKSSFAESVGHALDGIEYTTVHERNFRIELLFAILVSIASFIFQVSIAEWVVLVLTIGLVLALELLNTAIERTVDLVTKDYLELAKHAKDAAAGAVFVMSIFSVVIGVSIFLPKLLALISWLTNEFLFTKNTYYYFTLTITT